MLAASTQGMKSRQTDPATFFLDTIALCPALAERLREAKLCSPVTATGNYSYEVKRATGRNYLLLGDAFTFIDPVFSTGVLFAMQSAFAGADTVEACLDRPHQATRALRAFDRSMRHGPRIFSWFIYRVTTPTMRDLFMGPGNAKLQEAVLSVLAGDIFRNTPLGLRLFAFKIVYYLKNSFNPRRTLSAWIKRKQLLQASCASVDRALVPARRGRRVICAQLSDACGVLRASGPLRRQDAGGDCLRRVSGQVASPRADCPYAWVDMPVLGGDAMFEVWTSAQPVVREDADGVVAARNAGRSFRPPAR